MEENLIVQLTLLKEKYEKLNLTNSVVYTDLCSLLSDKERIKKISLDLNAIKNGDKVFNVVKKISAKLTQEKNDEVVLSAFAEYDTGRWLVSGFIEGKYDEIVYNPPSETIKLPDYYVRLGQTIKPVETKIISPEDLDEDKAVRRIIERVNNGAIPQLQSFSSQMTFDEAMVFMWTHKPIEFRKISYHILRETFEKSINPRTFKLLILLVKYNEGLWDFNV